MDVWHNQNLTIQLFSQLFFLFPYRVKYYFPIISCFYGSRLVLFRTSESSRW